MANEDSQSLENEEVEVTLDRQTVEDLIYALSQGLGPGGVGTGKGKGKGSGTGKGKGKA
ncbi:hypothetical protein [Candidatus Entotheonella palauensis]|uniref:Uncharacterized protein n=1 Tax=Candidatus Entotheonella gemina TaxID=1429439 RepID=W4M2Y3_9BACT|nr:hypothetical protein [Candidatus Entotheonella palauensis]ETX04555.1 MAG: hypothetical protein ETSY2_28125 [Candidatus Entotheonella gemina]